MKNIRYFINPDRLKYLLNLYQLSKADLIGKLNVTKNGKIRKNIVDSNWLENIVNKEADLSLPVIKRICDILSVSVPWIISNRQLRAKNNSIFFRKKKFNTELDFIDKRIINNFEKLKIEVQLLTKYINYKPKREFKAYNHTQDNARDTAINISLKFFSDYNKMIKDGYIKKARSEREYLSNLIRVLEKYNLFIFERVETWNQKERLHVDGLFMSPNFILIKRNQSYLRKEIFTLAHEFAHYLLNMEEVDTLHEVYSRVRLSSIEQWCHTFAFYFLLGDDVDAYHELHQNTPGLEGEVRKLYEKKYLSYTAVYTRLKIDRKISTGYYDAKVIELKGYMADKEKEKNKKREMMKSLGVEQNGRAPKAIESSIFRELVSTNFLEGNISEYSLRDYLKIKPEVSLLNIISL